MDNLTFTNGALPSIQRSYRDVSPRGNWCTCKLLRRVNRNVILENSYMGLEKSTLPARLYFNSRYVWEAEKFDKCINRSCQSQTRLVFIRFFFVFISLSCFNYHAFTIHFSIKKIVTVLNSVLFVLEQYLFFY